MTRRKSHRNHRGEHANRARKSHKTLFGTPDQIRRRALLRTAPMNKRHARGLRLFFYITLGVITQ